MASFKPTQPHGEREQTIFIECPVIPAAFLIHERKFRECHEKFFNECIKHVPTLCKASKPIVTDDEKGIVGSIKKTLPNHRYYRLRNRDMKQNRALHSFPYI